MFLHTLVTCLHTSDCLCLLVIGFCGVTCDLNLLPCHVVVCLAIVCVCVCMPVCCSVVASPGQYFYFQEAMPILAAKHCIMQANAEFHQSIMAKQKKCFGEEIARLQVSEILY